MKSKSVLVMLDPLSLPRLEVILGYARAHSWSVILEDRLPEGGLERIDGALVSLRGRAEPIAKVKFLLKNGKPVVDLTIACPKLKLPRVISDHKALGELAARHFLERGFRNFAWYAAGKSHVHDLRRQGYAKTLREAGFAVSNLPDLLVPQNLPKLHRFPRPLAVLAFDESDAARVIAACRRARLEVPEDIAVLGISNDPFLCENGDITISSVDQNLAGAAREACALLDSLMSRRQPTRAFGQSDVTPLLIPPVGVIPRASTETLSHPDPTVRAALVYIHRHLNKSFGGAETANAIGVARSTLDHLFTAKLGHSIGEEILRQRLLRARRLLKDNSVQLKDIAAACGFCNASYFTNVFRRETGLGPKAWRKAHQTD